MKLEGIISRNVGPPQNKSLLNMDNAAAAGASPMRRVDPHGKVSQQYLNVIIKKMFNPT